MNEIVRGVAEPPVATSTNPDAGRLAFNDYLNSTLTLVFMAVVVLVLVAAAREWYLVLNGKKAPMVRESPFVQSAYAAGD